MAGGNTNAIRGYNIGEGMFNVNGNIGTAVEFIETNVNTGTITAADFALPSKYRAIDFIVYGLSPSSGGSNIHILLSDDGGATFKTGATDYRYNCETMASSTADNTFLSTNSNGDSKILIATNLVSTQSMASRFTVRVMGHDVAIGSTVATTVQAVGVKSINTSGPPSGIIQSYGRRNIAESHNAIRFVMSSGNLQMNYTILGYRHF